MNSTATSSTVPERFRNRVVPTYGRFPTELVRGQGVRVWDQEGRRYLDLGAGIAVCSLGHAHPALAEAIGKQAQTLIHVSNLYHHELQVRLAEKLTEELKSGKCFFCNSGAEANEALIKLARRIGHASGRYEIVSCLNSFHGRTLATLNATGQDKIRRGFGPSLPGFWHVPFNDLEALRSAVSPATAAVLVEGIQGEGGIHPARPDYLTGLRALCDKHGLLLLYDGVQCGHFRTGRFQSFQRILETDSQAESFRPDGISMAKSMGGGFPMGAVWIDTPHADVLSPGTHGTTYGGSPLACAAALAVLEEIQSSRLERNAREVGRYLKSLLENLHQDFPEFIGEVRGLGLMIGVEFQRGPAGADERQSLSLNLEAALRQNGLLTIPSGQRVIRFLPPLNLRREEAEEAVDVLRKVLTSATS